MINKFLMLGAILGMIPIVNIVTLVYWMVFVREDELSDNKESFLIGFTSGFIAYGLIISKK